MIWSTLKRAFPQPLKRVTRLTLQNVRDSIKYIHLKNNFGHNKFRHILFVCKGNICRSAFAEYYLKQKILVKGITIESCGLDVDQGIFSPAVAVRIAKEFDLSLDSHRAKSLASCDIHRADLILPMELQQYICLITMFPDKKQKIKLLRDFAPWPVRLFCNINDPYGSDENEFRHCFRQMQKALEGLINFLAIDNNLRTE